MKQFKNTVNKETKKEIKGLIIPPLTEKPQLIAAVYSSKWRTDQH